MKKLKSNFIFFDYLTVFFSQEGFSDFVKKPTIEVYTSLHKKWILQDNNVVSSVHPPLQTIKLQTAKGEFIAEPFKRGRNTKEPVDNEDIQKIIQQNNFSNQILGTIANQLDIVCNNSVKPSRENILNKVTNPFFKTESIPKGKGKIISFHNQSNEILNKIQTSLSGIGSSKRINALSQETNEIKYRKALDGIRAIVLLDFEDERVMNLNDQVIIYRPGRFNHQLLII